MRIRVWYAIDGLGYCGSKAREELELVERKVAVLPTRERPRYETLLEEAKWRVGREG